MLEIHFLTIILLKYKVSTPNSHLSFRVAVAILVLVPQRKLLWVTLLNLLVCHLLTNPLWQKTQIQTF